MFDKGPLLDAAQLLDNPLRHALLSGAVRNRFTRGGHGPECQLFENTLPEINLLRVREISGHTIEYQAS